jgi:hypothetical protein
VKLLRFNGTKREDCFWKQVRIPKHTFGSFFIVQKTFLFALFSATTALLMEPALAIMPPAGESTQFVSHTLIVYYDASLGREALLEAAKKEGAKVVYDYKIINAVALSIPEKDDIEKAITAFEKVSGVLQVVRDQVQHTMRIQ